MRKHCQIKQEITFNAFEIDFKQPHL